jgi:integrase
MSRRRSRGEGSIFQRKDGLWSGQITLPNGKRKCKYGKTQKEVKDWLLEQRESVAGGVYTESPDITLGDFLDRYINEIARNNCKPHTVIVYEALVRLHVKPALGRVKLSALRPDQIQHLYNQMYEQGLARRTVHHTHAIVHKALEYALKWGLVPRNVASAVEVATPKRRVPTVWTKEQMLQFLEAVKDQRYYALFLLACTTGLRKGELFALTWNAVDFDGRCIQVRQAAQYVTGKGMVVSDPKTDRARRKVAVPQFAMQALHDHRLRQEALAQATGDRWVKSDFVFTSNNGTLINDRNFHEEWKRLIRLAKVPDIRFHDLRHTHSTLLLLSGIHPKVVQERLGHASIAITLDVYSHVLPEMGQQAADQMEKLVAPHAIDKS